MWQQVIEGGKAAKNEERFKTPSPGFRWLPDPLLVPKDHSESSTQLPSQPADQAADEDARTEVAVAKDERDHARVDCPDPSS